MKQHTINETNSFIAGWYIDESLCDSILEYQKIAPDLARGVYGQDGRSVVNTDVKDSYDCMLSNNYFLAKNYVDELQKVLLLYIEKYPACNKFAPFSIIEEIRIQHYYPRGAYHAWHSERCSADYPYCNRHLVFLTYLNDVETGGETEFMHQQIKIKPEKGLTLIWPTDWTYTHRGIPAPDESKYIVTGWYTYMPRPEDA